MRCSCDRARRAARVEPPAIAEDLRALGVPVAFEMREPATAEGGDTMWLDQGTLLVGRSYRTNDAGIDALRDALPGVEVLAFDLPRVQGPDACLHLLSLLSPLDDDLVVAYPPLMPIRLLELLAERAIAIVEVPEEEFDSMGPNVLTLAPRVAVALEGNPETRKADGVGRRRRLGVRGLRDRAQGRGRTDLPHPPAAPRVTRTAQPQPRTPASAPRTSTR